MPGKLVTIINGDRAVDGYFSVSDMGEVEIRYRIQDDRVTRNLQDKLQAGEVKAIKITLMGPGTGS